MEVNNRGLETSIEFVPKLYELNGMRSDRSFLQVEAKVDGWAEYLLENEPLQRF